MHALFVNIYAMSHRIEFERGFLSTKMKQYPSHITERPKRKDNHLGVPKNGEVGWKFGVVRPLSVQK